MPGWPLLVTFLAKQKSDSPARRLRAHKAVVNQCSRTAPKHFVANKATGYRLKAGMTISTNKCSTGRPRQLRSTAFKSPVDTAEWRLILSVEHTGRVREDCQGMDALSIRAVKISRSEGTRRAGYVGGAPFEYFSSRNEKYFATPGDTGI